MQIEKDDDGKPWYYDLVQYLKYQTFPECGTENDKKVIRRLAGNFFSDGEILYKKMQDHTLLRCVEEKEARLIMEEVHEGVFGTRANRHRLTRQIMRAGYYWLTMESDCILYT